MANTQFIEFALHPLVVSILILISALILKLLLSKLVIHRARRKERDGRSTANDIRHLITFVSVVLLLFVWAAEIQHFALSIAAFAAAIVLATRDFIQCIVGFFYLATTRPFKIGDWVQLGDHYGEVITTDWMKTILKEIDMHTYQVTRKTLYVPNSMLISSPIKNLNNIKRFVTHRFSILRKESIDPFPVYASLLEKAKLYCSEFEELAKRYNAVVERRLGSAISGPAPEIHFTTSDTGEFKASFVIFCPTEKAIHLEHQLTADFMSLWYQQVVAQQQ